jgi:adenosylcobinamide-phosphate synthase
MELLLILLLALGLDLLVGEPPRPIHPVVWMGKVISLGERLAPSGHSEESHKWPKLIYGGAMALLTIAIFTSAVYFLLHYVYEFSPIAYIIVGALVLKPSFSFRELRRTALDIKTLLSDDNLEEARARMPALVSRETWALEKPAIVSATIESVAENLCDSFVAPIFYFLILGVAGAIAYRVVNTLDAMIGYHGKYEYLGKVAARLDDILNFIPARISGILLVIAARLCQNDSKNAWRIMLRDHGKTESPNAGWSMSAMAGALKTQLEKLGCYTLGEVNNPLSPQLIASGVKLAGISVALWASLCVIVEVMQFAFIT